MTTDDYPEIKPNDSSTLILSLAAIPAFEDELEKGIDKIQDRIDKLNERYQLAGYPIISQILKISHDQEELNNLATGLSRAAKLIAALDLLEDKHRALLTVKRDPNWFAIALGDIEKELGDFEQGKLALETS